MPKTIKIPLEMKNGEKATDMKSLVANFDVESVVGYFLDGKLKKWLDDRYYEEEAEKVSQLEKDDPALAAKLCEIFGVPYEAGAEIDTEELADRKERLSHLKQLTDDEEILRNIDSVAFNQEELAELYDKGVQKIYLCEGDFHIPKSKQELEYVLVADATVEGPKAEVSKSSREMATESSFQNVPIEIADDICGRYPGYEKYAFSPTYFVHQENGSVIRINQNTFQRETTTIPYRYGNLIAATDTTLLFIETYSLWLYDIQNRRSNMLCKLVSFCGDGRGYSICGSKIAYLSDDSYNCSLCIADLSSGIVESEIKNVRPDLFSNFAITPSFVLTPYGIFVAGSTMYTEKCYRLIVKYYNSEQKKIEHCELLAHYRIYVQAVKYYNGNLFIFVADFDDADSEKEIYRVSCTESNPVAHKIFSGHIWNFECSMPYIVLCDDENNTLSVLNVDSGECHKDVHHISRLRYGVVGQYLYFHPAEQEFEIYRQNLANLNEEAQKV